MTDVRSCPERAALEPFVHNRLSPELSRSFEEHLLHCEACLTAVEAACGLDTVADALRNPPSREETADEPAVGELIERLRGIRAAAIVVPPHDGGRLTSEATPREAAGIVSETPTGLPPSPEDLEILAPAQGPGEIGRLGPYRVLGLLGKGGMGAVYLAEDPHLGRRVALKTLHAALAADKKARERFLREARAAAALEHDHIVAIFQVGEERGVPFLAMPLLKGESLEARLKAEPKLPLAEAVRIAREAAEGLACAHAAGLIHRDVKPANLWLEPGPRRRVKVLDFGLARPTESSTGLTETGAIVGTPGYMAPEQAGGTTVDGRVDLFSLGVVLYRMLTGRAPYRGGSMLAYIDSLVSEHLKPPQAVEPALPEALSNLVMRLLARNAEDRPANAEVVVAELAAIQKDLESPLSAKDPHESRPRPEVVAGSQGPPKTPSRGSRRRWAIVAGVAAAGLLLLLATLGPSLFRRDRGDPDTRVVQPGNGTAGVVAKVKVLNMDVEHFTGEAGDPCGLLGDGSFVTHFGDDVTVAAKLSRPGFAYLISFRPDGKEELVFPDSEEEPPPEVEHPHYPWSPADRAKHYALNDGEGLQVFAVVVLRRPLPYREWKSQRGEAPWKKEWTPPDVVWWDDGVEIERLTAQDRSKGKDVRGAATVAALTDWLRKAPDVETVAAVGFAVLPKGKR